MSFKNRLYQNFIWRGLYFVSVFALNVVMARSYEAELIGWINFISSNFALAISFGSLSFEVAILYFGSASIISKEKLATFSLAWSTFTSIIFSFVFGFIVSKSDAIASKGLLEFGATNYFIGIMFTNFFVNMFIMRSEFMLPNMLLGIMNILLILMVPGNVLSIDWFDKQSFLYLYFFWYTLQAFTLILCYFMYTKKLSLAWLTKQELKKLFTYALPATFANVSYFFLCRVDYWMIDYYRNDLAELGNYTHASKMGQTLLIFGMIAAQSIFVMIAATENLGEQIKKIFKLIRLFLVFFIGVFVVFLVIGNWLFPFVFGESFNLMFWPFMALVPGVFFLTIIVLLGALFGAINKPIYNVWCNIVGVVFIIIADMLFVKRFGINAAAIICSIGYGFSMLFGLYLLYKTQAFSWKSLWQFSKNDFDWVASFFQKKAIQL